MQPTRAGDGAVACASVRECPPEIDTAAALRRRASGLLVLVVLRCALVVLRCALDRRYPALAPLHPDLVFGLQLEGRVIQTSDPNLDERVVGVGCVKEPRPTAGAEAATVIARDLAAHLKRLYGPFRIHTERTARFLSAIRAVATPDIHRVTANAVADRPAETSAGAYSCLHARRCYATLRCASVQQCRLTHCEGCRPGQSRLNGLAVVTLRARRHTVATGLGRP